MPLINLVNSVNNENSPFCARIYGTLLKLRNAKLLCNNSYENTEANC